MLRFFARRSIALKKKQKKMKTAADIVSLNEEIDWRRNDLEDERNKGRDIGPLDNKADIVPCYFNDGCGLYTDGITAIEIENDDIRLVQWSRSVGNARKVFQKASLEKVLAKI